MGNAAGVTSGGQRVARITVVLIHGAVSIHSRHSTTYGSGCGSQPFGADLGPIRHRISEYLYLVKAKGVSQQFLTVWTQCLFGESVSPLEFSFEPAHLPGWNLLPAVPAIKAVRAELFTT
jgi:hypothetical protein